MRTLVTVGECSAAEAARLRVMRIYATRLKRLEMDSPRRGWMLRMLMLLDSAAGRELCALLLDKQEE
jgi:hypothetical protein